MLGGAGTRLGAEAAGLDAVFLANVQAAIGPTLKGLQADGSNIPALFRMLQGMKDVFDPTAILADLPRKRMVLVSALKQRTQAVVLCAMIQNFLATKALFDGDTAGTLLNEIKINPLVVKHEPPTEGETPVVTQLKVFAAAVAAARLHDPLPTDPTALAKRQILLRQSQLVGEQLAKVLVLAVQLMDMKATFT
jgi:hypothetical protein